MTEPEIVVKLAYGWTLRTGMYHDDDDFTCGDYQGVLLLLELLDLTSGSAVQTVASTCTGTQKNGEQTQY